MGRGNYFAENLHLADNYAYLVPERFSAIFEFKIITRKMIQLLLDKTLTISPLIHHNEALFQNERYNTVVGQHPSAHGIVFVMYSNQGIYPEYLITYF